MQTKISTTMDTPKDAEVVNSCRLGLARDRTIAINAETDWRLSWPSRRKAKPDLIGARIESIIGQQKLEKKCWQKMQPSITVSEKGQLDCSMKTQR